MGFITPGYPTKRRRRNDNGPRFLKSDYCAGKIKLNRRPALDDIPGSNLLHSHHTLNEVGLLNMPNEVLRLIFVHSGGDPNLYCASKKTVSLFHWDDLLVRQIIQTCYLTSDGLLLPSILKHKSCSKYLQAHYREYQGFQFENSRNNEIDEYWTGRLLTDDLLYLRWLLQSFKVTGLPSTITKVVVQCMEENWKSVDYMFECVHLLAGNAQLQSAEPLAKLIDLVYKFRYDNPHLIVDRFITEFMIGDESNLAVCLSDPSLWDSIYHIKDTRLVDILSTYNAWGPFQPSAI